mgnify:CR=1 FL=1
MVLMRPIFFNGGARIWAASCTTTTIAVWDSSTISVWFTGVHATSDFVIHWEVQLGAPCDVDGRSSLQHPCWEKLLSFITSKSHSLIII